MRSFVLAIFFASFILTFGERARYDNYRIYSVEIRDGKQLKLLQDLESHQDGISFMHSPTSISRKVAMLVPPHKFAYISDLFELNNMKNSIKIDNLQEWVKKEDLYEFVLLTFTIAINSNKMIFFSRMRKHLLGQKDFRNQKHWHCRSLSRLSIISNFICHSIRTASSYYSLM